MAKRKIERVKVDANAKTVTVIGSISRLHEDERSQVELLVTSGYTLKTEKLKQTSKQKANAAKTKKKAEYLKELTSKADKEKFESIIKEENYFAAVKWFNNREK